MIFSTVTVGKNLSGISNLSTVLDTLANERRNGYRYQFQLFFIVIYIVLRSISYIKLCLYVQRTRGKYSHKVTQGIGAKSVMAR